MAVRVYGGCTLSLPPSWHVDRVSAPSPTPLHTLSGEASPICHKACHSLYSPRETHEARYLLFHALRLFLTESTSILIAPTAPPPLFIHPRIETMRISVENFKQHLLANGWTGALDQVGTEVQEFATFTVTRSGPAWNRAAPTQAFPGVAQHRPAPMMGAQRRRPPVIGRGRNAPAPAAGPPEYFCVAKKEVGNHGWTHFIAYPKASALCTQIGIPAPPVALCE